MPYIKQEQRITLDKHIERLAEEIKKLSAGDDKTAFAGLLNYSCTKLALALIPKRGYAFIALITGVFKNIADEFYRRYAAPYEDEKIKENGDVYPVYPIEPPDML
ncbi:MAG: hypothetical protein CO002_03030 [Candidatus Portnoybacteria bacterium CG_4_8_14_3_um_filter_44_10]|uniref:Uncharacterized protein n=5 Tax=Candidatus Portnoyibacteriota TaxID=1817913 RepID=A0A2H0KPA0_9BACT|nr:MAG: hypothetical protein COV85_04575 [Candidatus Portnoybacteria bacterium CG11_big_fil_rev_8_21_14_0_20_44_10]PIS16615.1 MAG: hypothetical protein COT61_02955 [Candidatus Portnoybacteria bacterium CG09_land_8_20_14_0_10_44_13]PIW75258.1 MAG: hypothetical protein CO002_03030 [Candidatus Portnoybacteria bacterium CG_4_8_14_3_um_filter_44_10]PIZ71494.1 MAG: hypothetical protein COY11_01305 [Candidatus Portnoybacteria bacterium CG_4_10_14_0_2_um_filter_44_20]PJA62662.1 MAG: hypothetical protei